ncbi:MAG: hypothetical protein V7645_1144 [Actinomycetota bacterium]
MHRRLLIVAACVVFVAAIIAPGAGADPTNAKNATRLFAMCGGQRVDVVVIGNGEFTPAHDVASTSVFIPTAFDTTFTFTPSSGGEPVPEPDMSAKSAPLANTVTCDIPLQTIFSGPEGTGTIQGSVTGFFTPR